ncbi:MAG: zf-TFIIB domain-containing protein [Lachnospiraceae bacterium]|nr:zf-TFIIB domain-containing protein [Lachnospiraceae bacterium]
MPYCPKCDMEFVEGVKKCTDCGGPLFESKEAADACMAEAAKKQQDAMKAQYEKLMAAAAKAEAEQNTAPRKNAPTKAYVNKEQRYEDMSSSATAFFIIGGALAVASVLILAGVINLPMYGIMKYIFQGMMIVMAIGSLAIAFSSRKSANVLKTEAVDEEKETEEIVEWFVNTYSGKVLDKQILAEEKDLSEEEMSLRRFDLIQDYLITGRDLPDQSYVDALCDMIYNRLYEE